MPDKLYILFLISLLTVFLNLQAGAELIQFDSTKSKVTYTLTSFGIPFKRKPLPATGEVDLDKNQFFLRGLNLKANFTSKNKFFRKLINFDEYPYFSFSSSPEKPLTINDLNPFYLSGNLSFHGVTRQIEIELHRINNNEYSLAGDMSIKMTDFGITPPRIFFIPVDNIIKIKVEIFLNTRSKFY